jgi:hypothetical protein|tara:strand:+ start:717 stop:911 length:195 start_codon:yes stop_codon:yes gene_type:complete
VSDAVFGVPQHNRGGYQAEAAGPVALWNTVYLERATQGLTEAGKPTGSSFHTNKTQDSNPSEKS